MQRVEKSSWFFCDIQASAFRRRHPGKQAAVMRGLDPRIHLLRKKFCKDRWIASQLGLARVAQCYAPQVG
jgi:hypothetical protein